MRNKIFLGFVALLVIISNTVYAQVSFDVGGVDGGAIIFGSSTSVCNASIAGAIRYDTVNNYHEYCDSTSWRKMISATGTGIPFVPPAGSGFFVISSGTWDADLETAGVGSDGIDGANKLCLNDLTANDWLGKGSATLDAAHVYAFVCTGTCNNLIPLTTYNFAVSGDNTKGGASFVTDASGRGPQDSANWSATNYFDGNKQYWANRKDDTGDSIWSSITSTASSSYNCGQLGSNTGVNTVKIGVTNNTGRERWLSSSHPCDQFSHLVCFVDP